MALWGSIDFKFVSLKMNPILFINIDFKNAFPIIGFFLNKLV
jgi:hypothetical protein